MRETVFERGTGDPQVISDALKFDSGKYINI